MKLLIWIALFMLCTTGIARAEILIVGSSDAPELSAGDAKKLFLGKKKSLSGIGKPSLLALEKGSDIRIQFNRKLLNKNDAQLQAYWAKRIFTGKGQPPKEVANSEQVIATITGDKSAIGYIDSAALKPSVKVLYRMK